MNLYQAWKQFVAQAQVESEAPRHFVIVLNIPGILDLTQSHRTRREILGDLVRTPGQEISPGIACPERYKHIFAFAEEIAELIIQPPAHVEAHLQEMFSNRVGQIVRDLVSGVANNRWFKGGCAHPSG